MLKQNFNLGNHIPTRWLLCTITQNCREAVLRKCGFLQRSFCASAEKNQGSIWCRDPTWSDLSTMQVSRAMCCLPQTKRPVCTKCTRSLTLDLRTRRSHFQLVQRRNTCYESTEMARYCHRPHCLPWMGKQVVCLLVELVRASLQMV